MSKIYWDLQNKRQFINDIKYDNEINYNITLIKKYHDYEPHINFFPTVLKDIICEYINDVILLSCHKYKCWGKKLYPSFHFFGYAYINYVLTNFDFHLHYLNIPDKFVIDDIYIFDNQITKHDLTILNKRNASNKNCSTYEHNSIVVEKIINCITNIIPCKKK